MFGYNELGQSYRDLRKIYYKFESIMHKDEFYAACDRAGVDRPLTFELDMSTATELPSDEELGLGGYPVICKPSDSAAWHYAEFPGKEKVAEIADRAGLEKMFEAIKGSSYKGGLLLSLPKFDS